MFENKIIIRRRAGQDERKEINNNIEFEQKLTLIKNFLEFQNIKIDNGNKDGRRVSLEKEPGIVNKIKKKFFEWVITERDNDWAGLTNHPNRDKGDFYIRTSTFSFPVNLKLVTNEACNLCGTTTAISTALFGQDIRDKLKIANHIVNEKSFTEIEQHYGFIGIHKKTGEVRIWTFFNMNEESIIINRTNGIQFYFNKICPVRRSQREGQEFMAQIFMELCSVESEPMDVLRKGYMKGYNQTTLDIYFNKKPNVLDRWLTSKYVRK